MDFSESQEPKFDDWKWSTDKGALFKNTFLRKPYSLQSLTGKYMDLQGNPCNENRDPVMRTGVPCNENCFFPVRIDLQGVPCKPYRVWVCSVLRVLCNP